MTIVDRNKIMREFNPYMVNLDSALTNLLRRIELHTGINYKSEPILTEFTELDDAHWDATYLLFKEGIDFDYDEWDKINNKIAQYSTKIAQIIIKSNIKI